MRMFGLRREWKGRRNVMMSIRVTNGMTDFQTGGGGQYPVAPGGFLFQQELARLFYGMTWRGRIVSLVNIVRIFFGPAPPNV